MKKILLASTVLAMSAGFAAADAHSAAGITMSGSAAMGIGRSVTDGDWNDGEFHAYSTASLTFTMAGETDGGLAFGSSLSLAQGNSFDLDDGHSDEGHGTDAEVFISGSFGRLAMSVDEDGYGTYTAYHEDDEAYYEVEYTGTFGGLSVGVRLDVEGDAYDGDYSLNLGYNLSGIALGLNSDGDGDWDLSAGYTMGAVTATLATDHDEVTSLKLAYAAEPMTASVKFDTDDNWEIGLGYAANGMSVDLSAENGDVWALTGGYDLGGGASVAAGINSDEHAMVGVAFSF